MKNKKILNNLPSLIILATGIVLIFLIQFWIPTLYGADGYLHIRMAEFIREYGLKYDFSWARFSTFSDHFSDKDLLYHLLLISFTFFKNIFFGAKLAAAIFAALLFIAFYWLLKKYTDKIVMPLALVAFFFSASFLEAISRPRPITLVILVNILSLHFLIKKKHWWIFGLALAYNLGHVTGPLIIAFALIVEIIRYWQQKEFYYKTVIMAVAGTVVGFLIHPNFPNNFLVFYLNAILVPILSFKGGVLEFGAEFFPITTRDMLFGYPLVVIGVAGLILVAGLAHPKTRFSTKVFLVFAVIFFGAALTCKRYFVQGYVLMLLGFATYFADWLAGRNLKQLFNNKKIPLIITVNLILAAIVFFSINSYYQLKYHALGNRIYNGHFERIGNWMAANLPPGQTIFHTNWSDSQFFIGLSPKHNYLVTLDPIYMYAKNKKLYQLYRDVSFGRTKDPYPILKNTFKVNFGYAGKNYFGGLITQIKNDDRFAVIAEDNYGLVFGLK